MTDIKEQHEIWLCWQVDSKWKGWWWMAYGTPTPGRDPTRYEPLSADNGLSLLFETNPREVIVHVWTNAPYVLTLEVFRDTSAYEGPFKITGSDDTSVMLRLPAALEPQNDPVVYNLKGAYRDPNDSHIYLADPKFTFSRTS